MRKAMKPLAAVLFLQRCWYIYKYAFYTSLECLLRQNIQNRNTHHVYSDVITYPCLNADVANLCHDDVIKWKHFLRYWPFVRGIHRSPVNSPHKGQWRGASMFYLICVWINGWVNNREAGDLRRYRAHYDVSVMVSEKGSHVIYIDSVFEWGANNFI